MSITMYMDQKLIVKDDEIKQKEANNNLFLFCTLGVFGIGYGTIMGLIYYDIHHMSQNLDKLMDITNAAIAFANATSINSTDIANTHNTLLDMSICFLHKYCRNVPN